MEMGFQGYKSELQGGREGTAVVDDVRKGSWTDDEDALLFNYVTLYGEGHWNSVAANTGLKRTGKSCRLRWLNYLRPNLRRGNITLEEQLMILKLHCRWGNRWSKIASQMPGRTDNEIKNYWRTRVQKQAKHLKCDINSQQFRDMLHDMFIPRLVEKINASKADSGEMLMLEASTGDGVFSKSWDTHVSPISGLTESTYSGVSVHDCIESTWPEFNAPSWCMDAVPVQPGPAGGHFTYQSIGSHCSDVGPDQSFDIEAWDEESLRLLSQQVFEEC
ncbi:hypothetical protein MLD38_026333 [Melastoma candidum]|uniref:Uncharacterized protein n=1 Tax=Melastoma candidum TaxID=119954 RepID=A0ACB9NY91_9MYRT|nr:hypothetical protein MLD38_026333 [Melastoma candidum]